ncbi:hypothetical protein L1049_018020 [Liquidambar formosana]|uniref:Aminotransferase-like plant mobile domain-containing protein n=1 Tax=Liquidambar formosana TaxID=63359 RepID=A0AAP0NHT8_LIQFO
MNHAQPRARKIIKKAGFGPFLDALWNEQWDRQALFALTELWWDTTNTFHFSFGEMTMTPKDFTMITGLSLKGKRLEYYEQANMDQNYIVALLGVEAELSPKAQPPTMASSNDSNIKYPYYVIKNTYKAPIYDASQDKVLLEPKKHLSYLHSQHEPDFQSLRTRTSIKGLISWWRYMEHAQPRARKIVKKAGFGPFLDALWNEQWDRQALFALTELCFGEMTMTPKDFTMITGLSLKGKRLEYYEQANMDQNYIVALLGVEAELSPKVLMGWLNSWNN